MRKALLLLILMSLSLAVSAQDETPSDFMRAMAFAPNMPQNGYLFSYADYHAGAQAVGMDVPESWAAWEESGLASDFLLTLPRSGPASLMTTLLQGGPEYETHVGFDFFRLAQGVEVGMPPKIGIILLGDFTADAVNAAYAAQDYTEDVAYGDATMLCPPDGCDSGLKIDFNAITFHPFGGNLGRREPVLVADGVLFNSSSLETLEALGETYTAQADSLANLPAVQAIDAALADYPMLYSVVAYEGYSIGGLDPLAIFQTDAAAAVIEQFNTQLEEMPLPPYSLMAIAGMGDEDNNYGAMMLVYADEASANVAASSIDARLSDMKSLTYGQSFATIYGAAGSLDSASVFADETSGLYVVTVRIVSEWPEELTAGAAAIPFSRFYNSIIMRDTAWLTWSAGE